jgi:hypothetical protein
LPRIFVPPVSPRNAGFGLPRILHLPALPTVSCQVSPVPRSLGGPVRSTFERPRISHLPVAPPMRLRGTPNPASTAGSMMTHQSDSNFASSSHAWAADESSCQSGSCTFLPNSGCFLNLFGLPPAGQAGHELPRSIDFRIVLPGWNCVSTRRDG